MLQQGTKAPDFTLPDKDNHPVSLSDFKGKKVILYFYPKDNTKGCTTQACTFRDAYSEFEALGAVVIGVSKDSTRSHTNFASKYELPFLLLSDPKTEVIQAYDVWKEKKMYGKTYMGIVRTTFVVAMLSQHSDCHIFPLSSSFLTSRLFWQKRTFSG